ncbi:MAG: type II toxin-antitoxin system VapC family toxin [Propionibacteriaceae bacterium]|jgi:predicted nucleic acid-binding protein|nr:type II toxin-antitoxin system VapC family toxin [Propionibacteriaceae bacterium]
MTVVARVVADASFLIALLNPAETHHGSAVAYLAQSNHHVAVHPVTLAEVLVGVVPAHQEESLLSDLESAGVSSAPPDVVDAAAMARARSTSGLKMPEAIVLATALAMSAGLATFDDRLRSAAQRQGVTLAV